MMRDEFEAFVREQTVNRNPGGPWPTPTELAWLAWQARDAEVQALREMLREGTRLLSHMEVSAGYCVCGESPERHPSDHQYVDTAQRVINHWIKDAAALAGGEEGEAE